MQNEQPSIHLVALNPLDIACTDTTFVLRPDPDAPPPEPLVTSIRRFGILHPPLILGAEKEKTIVSGRHRVTVARQLGLDRIPCLVIAPHTASEQLLATLLVHARIGADLSPVEQAIFFSRLAPSRLRKKQVLTLLPLAGLKPASSVLTRLQTLLDLSHEARMAVHQGLLHPKNGEKLHRLDNDDQKTAVAVIQRFSMGGSKQRKFIDLALELVGREQRPLAAILQPLMAEKSRQDNRPQQLAVLLTGLKRLTSPRLTRAEQEFTALARQLDLPGNVRLSHTPAFEDTALTLCLDFSDSDQLRRAWPKIAEILMEQESP